MCLVGYLILTTASAEVLDVLYSRLYSDDRRRWLNSMHLHSGMIRKLKSGQYRLYSRKKDASTGKRRNLGTFSTLAQAKQHEREVQYFKRH